MGVGGGGWGGEGGGGGGGGLGWAQMLFLGLSMGGRNIFLHLFHELHNFVGCEKRLH